MGVCSADNTFSRVTSTLQFCYISAWYIVLACTHGAVGGEGWNSLSKLHCEQQVYRCTAVCVSFNRRRASYWYILTGRHFNVGRQTNGMICTHDRRWRVQTARTAKVRFTTTMPTPQLRMQPKPKRRLSRCRRTSIILIQTWNEQQQTNEHIQSNNILLESIHWRAINQAGKACCISLIRAERGRVFSTQGSASSRVHADTNTTLL